MKTMKAFKKLSDLDEEDVLKRMIVPRHYYRISLPSIKLPSIVHSARTGLPPLFQHTGQNGSSSFRLRGIVGFAEHVYNKKEELPVGGIKILKKC